MAKRFSMHVRGGCVPNSMARSENREKSLKKEHVELVEKFANFGLTAEEFCRLAILENEIVHSGPEIPRGLLQMLLNVREDALESLAKTYLEQGPVDIDKLSLSKALLSETQRLLDKPWLG